MLGNEIIEATDEIRVVWYFEETAFPYVLEVNDRIKGWVPLMFYDAPEPAVDTMRSLIRDSQEESEEGRDTYIVTHDNHLVRIGERSLE